jgi:hypothetical protein
MKTIQHFLALMTAFLGFALSALALDPTEGKDVMQEKSLMELERFFFTHKRQVVSSIQWNTFSGMVKRYHLDKAAFYNTQLAERERFNTAVTYLQEKLGRIRFEEASLWLNGLNETARILNNAWNFNPSRLLPTSEDMAFIQEGFNTKRLLPQVTEETYYLSEKGQFDLSRLLPASDQQLSIQEGFDVRRLLPAEQVDETFFIEGFDIRRLLPQDENLEESIPQAKPAFDTDRLLPNENTL